MVKKRIIVVEDERLIAEDIKRTLLYLGYDVLAVISTGEAALEEVEVNQPDLVLMDIMLEGEMSGIEAAEKIYSKYSIPIIFLTAYSNDQTLQEATAAEPYGYILKPFEERELHATIEMAFYKHNMQKKLLENEKKYRDIFENANESICVIQDKKIAFCNPKTEEYLGLKKDKILGRTFISFAYNDDKDIVKEGLFNGTPDSNSLVFRLKFNKQDVRWVKLNSVQINWESSNALLCFMSDISDQLIAEEESKQFKTISENSNFGQAITDLNWNIKYINENYAESCGFSILDLIGDNLSSLFAENVEKTLNEMMTAIEENGKFTNIEVNHMTKFGQPCAMLMNGIIIDDNKTMDKLIAISAIDITDRNRSAEIQSKLFVELESVNDELQNFAYVVSHDLKAPLRAISTLANWISTDYSSKFDDEGKEQMRLLISRVKRMHDLIDGILEYSRVGRIKEERIEVDLNIIAKEVIDIIAPPEHITISLDNELPTVVFESIRISQVFQNLLSNAIKFMDKPNGQIHIGSKSKGDYWEFYVKDNGPGIDQKHFEKIFKIFQTLQPRDEFESTGIGLTLIKKIINMYGGEIWLDSKLNEGSTFYFTIAKNIKNKNFDIN